MTYTILPTEYTKNFTKLNQTSLVDLIYFLNDLEFTGYPSLKLSKKHLFLYRLIIYTSGTICFPSQRKAYTMLSYLFPLSRTNKKLHFSFKAVGVSK